MAEGLLRFMAGDRMEAFSAGIAPQGINPAAVAVMGELGIDISGQRSEHVDSYVGSGIDTAITVCDRAASNCPTFPERVRKLHWNFDDPASSQGSDEERTVVFRRVREEIATALQEWLAECGQN